MPKRRRERARREHMHDLLADWLVADVCSVVFAYVGSFEGIFSRSIFTRSVATCLAAISDSQVVVGSLDGQLGRFNLLTSTKTMLEDKHDAGICDLVALSNSLVSLSSDGDLKIWDLATLRVKETRAGRGCVLLALPGDRFVCGTKDGTVTFWSAQGELELVKFCAAHHSAVRGLCFLDGFVVSISVHGAILRWDENTFDMIETASTVEQAWAKDPFLMTCYAQMFGKGHGHLKPAVLKLCDGTLLSGNHNGSLLNNGHVYAGGSEPVSSIAKFCDGFAALDWGCIRVWH